jgi:DNA-binding NarL/FixJ family response regulator
MKADTVSRHYLWKINIDGLKWYLANRKSAGVVFVATSGKAAYHEAESGSVIDGFANRWNDLIRRIRKDKGDDFPKYSFGKIRKTAATEILRLADPHIASMLLAHHTVSEDELLRRYANLPWEDLFAAQRKLEQELKPIFDAAGPDPFGNKPKTYIGVERTKAIFDLHELGYSAYEIADQLGTTASTVYRHLLARYGKNRVRPKKQKNESD